MKKTLLAAALLAGFAGAAHAQSSVTLYGIVDIGIVGTDKKYQSNTLGMESGVQSGSRWGLRGSEDLGNGLRANFQLESGFSSNTGRSTQNGRLFGREAWAGLSGGFGEIRVGRQVTASSQYFEFASPFGDSFGQAGLGQAFNGASTNRADNTIAYFTPNYSGFQAGLSYSFNYDGGASTRSGSDDLFSVGLKYANGPFEVAVTYEGVDLGSSNVDSAWNEGILAMGGERRDPYNFQIGGTWDFNVVKAYAAYSQMKHGFTNPEAGDVFGVTGSSIETGTINYFPGGKVNAYLLGVSGNVSPNVTLLAGWQMTDPSGGVFDRVGANKQNVYSLGATYALSKRTNLYAFYSYADEAWFDDNWKSQVAGIGIRHRF